MASLYNNSGEEETNPEEWRRPSNPYRRPEDPNPVAGGRYSPQGWPTPEGGPASPYNPYARPAGNPYAVPGGQSGSPYPPDAPASSNPYRDQAFGRPPVVQQYGGVYQTPVYRPAAQQGVWPGVFSGSRPVWTQILLAAIVIVFAGQVLSGGGIMASASDALLERGVLDEGLIRAGEWWRLITPIFLHLGIIHILFNGFALYAFGTQLEQLVGSRRFVVIFFVTGLGGSVLPLLLENYARGAGASGAIFGLLGALIGFFYRHRAVMGAWGQANLRSLLLTAGLNFIITLSLPNIGHFAHLGGLLSGVFLGYFLGSGPFRQGNAAGSGSEGAAGKLVREWWPVAAMLAIELGLLYLSLQGGLVVPRSRGTF